MSQPVNVINPEGELVSLPAEQVAEATSPENGYRIAAPEEVSQHFKEQEFGTLPQQALTGIEGVGEGVAGPVFTAAERLMGGNPERMISRREVNPGTHMVGQAAGLIGGSLLAPEATMGGVVSKVGEGAAIAARMGKGAQELGVLGKIGSAAAQGAAEMAFLQAGDETSKMIMNDPNLSFHSAVTDVGLAAAMGAGVGGGLGAVSPIWSATAGPKLTQFVEDFRGAAKQLIDNPDPAAVLRTELEDYYKGIRGVADEVYGPTGIKEKEINKLMPKLSDGIMSQANEIGNRLDKAIVELGDDPFSKKLIQATDKYKTVVTNPEATSEQVFGATQRLKQQLQEWGKFNKDFVPLAEKDFREAAKGIGFEVRKALEDPAVWGKAAERQQAINSAFKEFLPALKDFESKFTSWLGDERVIDPGKINTFINQLGKPNAELKQEMLGRFLDSAEKYRGVIDKSHANLGIESPFTPSSLQFAKSSTKEFTAGAKLAHALMGRGLAQAAGKGVGAGIGGLIGMGAGHGWIGALIGEHALGPLMSTVLPAIIKPILGGASDGAALKSVIDYSQSISRGQKIINGAVKNVLKPGAEVLGKGLIPDDKDRKQLQERIDTFKKEPDVAFNNTSPYANYLPDHGGAKGQVMSAAFDYLNAIKPQAHKALMFDKELPPSKLEQEEYNRQLDLAQQPAMIFDKIKDGSINIKDITTIRVIYPAFYQAAAEKLTAAVIDHTADGKEIPYTTRIGLAKFLAEPLDSTMLPESIVSIQVAMGTQSQMQDNQAMQRPDIKKPNELKKQPDMMRTATQTAEAQNHQA